MSQFIRLILLIAFAATTVSSGRIHKRLVNAANAGHGQFPYMVSLRLTSSSSHTCGGSLITPEHVITAAHCVASGSTPISPNLRYVVTGHLTNVAGGRVSQVVDVRNYHGYNASARWHNDISILKLAKPIPYTALEQPIAIASSEVGIETCVISGWGLTYSPASFTPAHLQTQLQDTISNEACLDNWVWGIYNSTLCAGTARGTGVCSGDSGGPLVCNGELAGVVSWGNPCANGRPDMYARVSYYSDWIREQTADLSPLGMSYMAEARKKK